MRLTWLRVPLCGDIRDRKFHTRDDTALKILLVVKNTPVCFPNSFVLIPRRNYNVAAGGIRSHAFMPR